MAADDLAIRAVSPGAFTLPGGLAWCTRHARRRSRRRLLPLAVAGLLAALLTGCEHSTYVHGTVLGSTPNGPRPLAGATVASAAAARVSTSEHDGGYDIAPKISCWYLPRCYSANPRLEFRAPGYRPRVVSLRSAVAERGVTRKELVPGLEIVLDVVLEPITPASGTPTPR